MALQKTIQTNHGLTVNNAYIKVHEISGNKNTINIRVRAYASQNASGSGLLYLEEWLYNFYPSIADDTPNFIKQAYLYLKTLPEFKDAIDA